MALALAVLGAACSSTNKVASRQRGSPSTTVAGSAVEPLPPGEAVASESGSRPSPEQPNAGSAGRLPTPDTASGGTKPPSARVIDRRPSQGVTASSIRVGIRYYTKEGLRAFAAAYGANPAGEVPDARGYAEAVVAAINAGGGMHGRKLDPVWQGEDAQESATNVDGMDQRTCSKFAEDAKVFAAVSSLPGNIRTFVPCMASHNTPVVTNPLLYVDRTFLDQNRPFLYMPSTPESFRMTKFWVDGLARSGFFKRGAKLGLLWYDEPTGAYRRTRDRALVPELGKRGLRLSEQFLVGNYVDPQQYANAALRMRSSGVTHLLIMDVSTLLSFFFMTNAETQGYRPAYGLNSFSVGTFLEANATKAQLRNITSIGWLPAWDVSRPQSPPLNAAEQHCLSTLSKAGQRVATQISKALAFWTCDTLFFLDTAVDRAEALNPAGLERAVVQVGARPGIGTFGARFGPGRPDGPTAWRQVSYVDACSCLRYVTDPRSAG